MERRARLALRAHCERRGTTLPGKVGSPLPPFSALGQLFGDGFSLGIFFPLPRWVTHARLHGGMPSENRHIHLLSLRKSLYLEGGVACRSGSPRSSNMQSSSQKGECAKTGFVQNHSLTEKI